MLYTISVTVLLITSSFAALLLPPIECGDMASRHEIRTISAVDRARLLAEYKHERRLLGPRRFASAIATVQLCEIVKRIDNALAPKRMPYWDVRWDLRLPWPADSVVFGENFFPRRGRRRAKEKIVREIVPRGLTSHFRRMGVNETLTSAIRASRAAQLLIMLYQLGQWKQTKDNCSHCSRSSPMAFCELHQRKCISRVMPTASCSTFSNDYDPCYASKCLEGVCVPLSESHDRLTEEKKKKKIAERAIPMTISASVEKTSSVPPDDVVFLLNIGDKEQLSPNDNRTLVDSNSTQIFEQSALTDAFNTTTEEQKAPMTASGRKAFSQDQISITSSMTAAPGPALNSTLTPLTTPHSDNPHFDRELNTWVYSFDDFLPYPSVYFSVMVIAGKYRPRPPSQRNPAGVTVFSRGENLPSGYTHIVKAFPFDNGHVIRILDPAASDVLVEFSFIVLKDGHECQRLCLYRRRYIECRRNTVRLSKYSALSDRVDFYKYGGFEQLVKLLTVDGKELVLSAPYTRRFHFHMSV